MLVSLLWPGLGAWPVSHADQGSWVGLSLLPEWELPEQSHDSQEGVGVTSPLPSFIWSGLGVGRLLSWRRLLPSVAHLPRPLTTEEVVDDGVGGAVGVHQPVGEGEAGIHGLSVAGLVEHPEHPRARAGQSEMGQMDVCLYVVLLIELKLQGCKVQEFPLPLPSDWPFPGPLGLGS